MLTAPRTPDNCQWRSQGNPSDVAECRLIRALVPTELEAKSQVDLTCCRVCCDHPEPDLYRPNRFIASQVYGQLRQGFNQLPTSTVVVHAAEQLIWIESFLQVEDCRGEHSQKLPLADDVIIHDSGWWQGIRNRLRRKPRIGLVGSNNQKGLGHQNRDLVRWLRIRDWLLHSWTDEERIAAESLVPRLFWIEDESNLRQQVERFLNGIDVLLFVERPHVPGLTRLARTRNVRVVCVPNWEWLHPGLDWLGDVDLMICPTVRTQRMLDEWKVRFGYGWETRLCPWPVDLDRFPFRLRKECRRFVMVHGNAAHPSRKGLDLLLQAAEKLTDIPFLVWSQTRNLPSMPSNVEVRFTAQNQRDLYEEGDVCVQLSRWEGLGLPLLECQAAGLPLITINEAPMNEHNPLALLPVAGFEVLELWNRRPILVPQIRLTDTVDVLRNWYGQRIDHASLAARQFIEREHSWRSSIKMIKNWISECFRSSH